VDEDVGLGRLRRPRPVNLASMLEEQDHLPTPRATLKALPTPHHPPSPLRMLMGSSSVDAYWPILAVALPI